MTNRKIIVKTDTYLSNTFPLNNGIPQGSPISVILFLIAYNSLTNIISIPREIKFCAYADDFHLIIEHNKRKNPTANLTDTFNQIDEMCTSKLKADLSKPLGIVKHLSSQKYSTNTASLIQVIKSLIISKIDYCLPIYGHAPKSQLNKFKTSLNSAIR